MTTAAKISIQIDAQTATLQKGFGEAKAAIQKLDAGMSSNVAMGMAKFNLGLAAVKGALAAVQGAVSSVLGAMDDMGKMDEFAQRLGMSADALTVLGYAAEQTGSSQETVNLALEKMQNLAGEAAAGTKTAAAAFAQLGISVEDLTAMSPDQLFAAIAEKIQGIGSSATQTKIAIDIFGKSGGQFVNLLKGGKEGLAAFNEEAEKMGLLMGNGRSAVEAAGDSINKMKRAWGGFVQQVTILVTPAIAAITEAMAALIGQFNQLMADSTGSSKPGFHIVGSQKYLAKKAARAAMQEVADAAKSKEAEDAKKKWTALGESLTESMRTPGETYQATMKQALELAVNGKITWATYARAGKQAIQDLVGTFKQLADWTTPGVGAVTRGSAAGFSAVQEAGRAKQDADRRHRELINWQARIEAAILKDTITIAPVSL